MSDIDKSFKTFRVNILFSILLIALVDTILEQNLCDKHAAR
ncbi:hypothetical protein bthur0007_58430 [Bacillus thuringiensis serovar monterrey BGSC 4AJ1]|nr:hypothetical protein bthur0007_58430 [Bacillus thuringiensis serovar monterrey BGSC 4AJ1]